VVRADRDHELGAHEGGLHRADTARSVQPGPLGALELVRSPGSRAWPDGLRRELEARVRSEWDATRMYGPVATRVAVWLADPLVTDTRDGRVRVPVLAEPELPVRGRFDLPELRGRRRVVLLLDASSSANARTDLRAVDGSVERVSVLAAEHRALAHLLDRIDEPGLELGVIAFGESTWPVARPGLPRAVLRQRLRAFREERPRGEGRTDLICALWTAWDWLADAPKGVEREIVLLSDGDLPHSGRFSDCARARGGARERCEAQQNRSPCPAERRLRLADGRSDPKQLDRLARRLRRKLRISPIVFEADRSARAFRRLAETTGGTFTQVPSVQAIERVLPPLVAGSIAGVRARNLRTGASTGDLQTDVPGAFEGRLPLAPGANDVELEVRGADGPAALFRFRVYVVGDYLERYLAELRQRNRALELRDQALRERTRSALRGSTREPARDPAAERDRTALRELDIALEPTPANASSAP
jgi:hypothetical protein